MLADERGSAAVEFVLVGMLLTALTLGVLQLGIALHVRNVVHDAAFAGAQHAALADTSLAEGVARTRELVGRTVGPAYAEDVAGAERADAAGGTAEIVVRAPLPLVGLWGIGGTMEVRAHAPLESLG
jgi:hypothetical protein